MSAQTGTSAEFDYAVQMAIADVQRNPDEAVRFAMAFVPVFVMKRPTPEMAQAGGCATCTYLGLWAQHWPGYGPSELGIKPENWHGVIFMFEDGIRSMTNNVNLQARQTLLHEIDHALERDHVLQHLQAAKAQLAAQIRGGCGYCGR